MWGSGTLDNKQLFIFIINIKKGHNFNYVKDLIKIPIENSKREC
jgi:hypothetical protein